MKVFFFHSKQPLEKSEPTVIFNGEAKISCGSYLPNYKWAALPSRSLLPARVSPSCHCGVTWPQRFLCLSPLQKTHSAFFSQVQPMAPCRPVPKVSGLPGVPLGKFRANLWFWAGGCLFCSRAFCLWLSHEEILKVLPACLSRHRWPRTDTRT